MEQQQKQRQRKQRRIMRTEDPPIQVMRPKVQTLEDDLAEVEGKIAALKKTKEDLQAAHDRILAAQYAQDEQRAIARRCYWPKGKPLPDSFVKVRRDPVPCPKCRRIRLDDGSQATACMSSGDIVAWFRCKSCGHRFKMSVEMR